MALVFGSAIHAALAAYYSELKSTREPLGRDRMLDFFRDARENCSSGAVPLQADEEDDAVPDQIADKGLSSCTPSTNTPAKRLPMSTSCPSRDPSRSRYVTSRREVFEELVGTIDLVVNEGGQRDR